ncbi:MAG: CPBP family intramembrane metalloprotease [Deinococcales bacterium]
MRRALLFLPSLVLGALGGAWLLVRPFPYTPRLGLGEQLIAGLAVGAALLGAAWLLERSVPSFRYASRLLEDTLRAVDLPPALTLVLAAATAGSEELFFRGALLPLIGLLAQAALFGLFHPVPRRAWTYPVFAAFAGLAFGLLTRSTGSLLPAMVAHFGINLQGLWEVRHKAPSSERAASASAPPTFPPAADRTGPEDAGAEDAGAEDTSADVGEEDQGQERPEGDELHHPEDPRGGA